MDKENMGHVPSGTLFRYKKQWDPVTCDNVAETEDHCVK
jgi:hypothetical protein